SGRRLLVVDDVVTNRLVVRLMLEPVGCTVAEATSGAEAITLLAVGERYDLALVDLHMPEMDGIEVVRRMRGVPGGDRLPIVLLTADVTEEARSRAIDAGVAGFLTKPIDYDRAMAEMAKHLQDSVLRPSAGTRETA
ncbi:MAG: response regulator, partial [Pseudomonadota bacterium]